MDDYENHKSMMLKVLDEKTDDQYILGFLENVTPESISVQGLVGLVDGLRAGPNSISIVPNINVLLDTCGTGGDSKGTYNISTIAAIIAASADIPIAKHGNYAVSSKCGSADVLKKLGYNINMTPDQCMKAIEKTGFGFLLNKTYYRDLERLAKIRKQIQGPTVMNLVGVLSNPAYANKQLVGVSDKTLCKKVCATLGKLNIDGPMVVWGYPGLDEISNIGETFVYRLEGENVQEEIIKPEDFGFDRCSLVEISGNNAEENKEYIEAILDGVKGPRRDIALLNAGAAIHLGYGPYGTFSLQEGVEKAKELVDSGKAKEKLIQIIEESNN